MAKVSILVPIYGAELYIEECARSLFEQSYPKCEFIFVNDASPDRSIERLNSLAAQYPHLSERIKIVDHKQNGGVAAARNSAIEAATGEYILFVDADDWVDVEIVEKLLLAAIESSADICNAWCESVDSELRREITPMGWLTPPLSHLKAVLSQSHIVPNHLRGMLLRRSLFESHNLRFTPRVDFGEDYSLLPQLLYHSKRLSTLREPLYYYRTENSGSYMNNIGERHTLNYIEAEQIVSRFVASLPESRSLQGDILLGKINIKKWIFRRGDSAQRYDALIFGGAKPQIKNPILRLYNGAINRGDKSLILLLSVLVNLPLYIRTFFIRR